MDSSELKHLQRCIALAREALEAGDAPFGSVLVDADGRVRAEERNRVATGDATRHPEFDLARWAARNMTPEQRAGATVYTSGEHCPMCSTAHALAGLGRIVYVSSSQQLADWLTEMQVPSGGVKMIPANEICRDVVVEGPVPELTDDIRALHRQYHARH